MHHGALLQLQFSSAALRIKHKECLGGAGVCMGPIYKAVTAPEAATATKATTAKAAAGGLGRLEASLRSPVVHSISAGWLALGHVITTAEACGSDDERADMRTRLGHAFGAYSA